VAVLVIAAAAGLISLMDAYLPAAPHVSLFLCAILFSTWFCGIRPGLLATVLSILAFDYFFVSPIHSLAVERGQFPRFITFVLTVFFVWAVSASARRATSALVLTRNDLQTNNDTLRAQGELMRVLSENANDFIRLHTVEGRSIYASPSVERLYGVVPTTLFEFAHPDDLETCQRWWEQVVAGHSERLRWRVRDAVGNWRWLETSASQFKLKGQPHVLTVCRDITENKRAEEALRRSEDRIRLIINTIPVMAWTVRPDGVVDFVNQRWTEYAGLTLEQYVPDLSGPIHPEDRARVFEKWVKQMSIGEPYDDEMRLRRADGEYRWFLVRTVPMRDEGGNIVKWYGVSTDIEDRKRSEEALRESQQLLQLVLSTLPVGVAVTNREGDVVSINAASKRIWGGAIVSGRQRYAQTRGFWHDSGEPIAPKAWASMRAIFEGQTSLNELIDIETYDGQRKTIENSAAPILNAHRQIVGAVIVNEDVTEQVRAEEKLRRSNQELRALSARLHSVREEESTRIAREIHDELGAVLSSLKWDLEEMHEAIPNQTDQTRLSELRDKLELMIQFTDSAIATVRRISSELRPIALEEFGLVEALRWHAQDFQDRTGISVKYEFPPGKIDLSQEQSTAVFRIFQEAMTNVLRHAQATQVDIAITKQGDEMILTVRDNGQGITETATSDRQSLGLLGMRERAHLLSGEISFERGAERGTLVTLRVRTAEKKSGDRDPKAAEETQAVTPSDG